MKGKAQEAFAAQPASEIGDYQKVKKTILLKYSLVPEAYRQKYRELKKKDNETMLNLLMSLNYYLIVGVHLLKLVPILIKWTADFG